MLNAPTSFRSPKAGDSGLVTVAELLELDANAMFGNRHPIVYVQQVAIENETSSETGSLLVTIDRCRITLAHLSQERQLTCKVLAPGAHHEMCVQHQSIENADRLVHCARRSSRCFFTGHDRFEHDGFWNRNLADYMRCVRIEAIWIYRTDVSLTWQLLNSYASVHVWPPDVKRFDVSTGLVRNPVYMLV
jgi:hypothetical protein